MVKKKERRRRERKECKAALLIAKGEKSGHEKHFKKKTPQNHKRPLGGEAGAFLTRPLHQDVARREAHT